MIIYVDVLFLLHIVIYAVILSLFQMLWRCDKKGVSFWVMVLGTSLIQSVQYVMQMSMNGAIWIWILGVFCQEFIFIRCYQLKGWRQVVSANAILLGCNILLGGVFLSVMQTSFGTWCMRLPGCELQLHLSVHILGDQSLLQKGVVIIIEPHPLNRSLPKLVVQRRLAFQSVSSLGWF